MERICPACGVKRNELAFERLIDGHVVRSRECVHCIAGAARKDHRMRKARARKGLGR